MSGVVVTRRRTRRGADVGLPPRAGLTLLELVVALAVTGLVLGAGYGAFGAALDHRRRATEATRGVVAAAEQRRTLVAWVAGARLTPEGDARFRGIDDGWTAASPRSGGAAAPAPSDTLELLTTAPTPLGEGEAVVRLYVDRNDSTPERGLVADLVEWRGRRARRVEIEPRAAGLDVRYLSGLAARREWGASWVSSSILPAAVELTLHSSAGDSLPPLLRLPILVPLGGAR